MDKRTIVSIKRKIERAKVRIGKERDALRDLVDELDSLHDDCSEAFESLEVAVDALSRLV